MTVGIRSEDIVWKTSGQETDCADSSGVTRFILNAFDVILHAISARFVDALVMSFPFGNVWAQELSLSLSMGKVKSSMN